MPLSKERAITHNVREVEDLNEQIMPDNILARL